MRPGTIAATATLVIAAALLSTGAPAEAAAAVQFGRIQYDSPGTDNRSNSSLNAEWVTITNHAATKRVLTGWTLRDTSRHVYYFPTFTLRPGYSVRVHTGRGTNTTSNLYWGRASYVWNNTGDTAILKNRSGTTLDRCSWGSSGPGYTYC